MAHYARVNSQNVVTQVTIVPNEIIVDENGIEQDYKALIHLYNLIPDSATSGDRWIKTSYNNKIRKTFANPGFTYNPELDIFLVPKPFESWIVNENTCQWEAPIPSPETPDGNQYFIWNEELGNWVGFEREPREYS